jgi:hypothetical protein
MLFNFSSPVLIRHLWQLKTVAFLRLHLIRAVLLLKFICRTMATKMVQLIAQNCKLRQKSFFYEIAVPCLVIGISTHVLSTCCKLSIFQLNQNKKRCFNFRQLHRHYLWRHDTQHNDIHHSDTQHEGLTSDIQHNETQHNDTQHSNTLQYTVRR